MEEIGSTLCFCGHIRKMEFSKMAFCAWETFDLALPDLGHLTLAVGVHLWKSLPSPIPHSFWQEGN